MNRQYIKNISILRYLKRYGRGESFNMEAFKAMFTEVSIKTDSALLIALKEHDKLGLNYSEMQWDTLIRCSNLLEVSEESEKNISPLYSLLEYLVLEERNYNISPSSLKYAINETFCWSDSAPRDTIIKRTLSKIECLSEITDINLLENIWPLLEDKENFIKAIRASEPVYTNMLNHPHVLSFIKISEERAVLEQKLGQVEAKSLHKI